MYELTFTIRADEPNGLKLPTVNVNKDDIEKISSWIRSFQNIRITEIHINYPDNEKHI